MSEYEDKIDKIMKDFFGPVRTLGEAMKAEREAEDENPEVVISFTRVSDDGTDELFEVSGETVEEAMADLQAQLEEVDGPIKEQYDTLWEHILAYAELASTSDVDEDFKDIEAKLGPLADIIGDLIAEALDEEEDETEAPSEEDRRILDLEAKVVRLSDKLDETLDVMVDLTKLVADLSKGVEDRDDKATPYQINLVKSYLDDIREYAAEIKERAAGPLYTNMPVLELATQIKIDADACTRVLGGSNND